MSFFLIHFCRKSFSILYDSTYDVDEKDTKTKEYKIELKIVHETI